MQAIYIRFLYPISYLIFIENDFQVINVEPKVAYLGCGFQEAADLQAAHFDILQKLQSKQSPVEDLLRQADNLICNHKNRAEVYTAMAESLGMAWRDLINLLDERKYILDQNYVFQGHFQVNVRVTFYFYNQRIFQCYVLIVIYIYI